MPNKKLPEEKVDLAVALLKAGKSYREVAAALDISVGSVHNISMEPMEEIEPLVAEIRKRLSSRYYLLANHVLGWIIDENIADASLKEKAIAAAILTDKALLLGADRPPRGKSMQDPPKTENEQNEHPAGAATSNN